MTGISPLRVRLLLRYIRLIMPRRPTKLSLLLTLAACSLAAPPDAAGDVELASIFGDHMVLQRHAPLPVWGTADPGEQVVISFAGQTADATADDDGRWRVTLDPVDDPGPHELVAQARNAITLSDVLVGETWLCGGQSNMEWSVAQSGNAVEEIAAADYPEIRIFTVARRVAGQPVEDVEGQWQVVSPETIDSFSAVAYYFGREVHQETGLPVGLISSNWGGTFIQPWMSAESLEEAGFDEQLQQAKRQFEDPAFGQSSLLEDTGIARPHWADPALDLRGWGRAEVPGPFVAEGIDFDGAAWYRRQVTVPEEMTGGDLTLRLGEIDDGDVTFFNGEEVGRTGPGDGAWMKPRAYTIPAELVRAGENTLAVRVFDSGSGGGFRADPGDLSLSRTEGDNGNGGGAIPLAGEWRLALERIVLRDPDEVAREATRPAPQGVPTALYNGMIAPLAPYAVRGFLWYQGESNAAQPETYASLLRGMINGWRDAFAGPEAEGPQPFFIVQLANFEPRSDDPNADPGWAPLREAQRQVAAEEGNGLAVTIDIGDADDIHPRNKQEVGRRLARLALRDVYEKDVLAEGPTARSATLEDDRVVVQFDHAEGLELRGEAEGAFAVGDASGTFVWAKPTVKGEAIELSFDGIERPTTVRYGWQINPPAPLYNAAELPAPPFELAVGER